jgi:D-3-phosphoglycerate dehydrogenase
MNVLYTKRNRLPETLERHLSVAWRELDALLGEADVVLLTVPHSAETERLIGDRELRLMKPEAYLVNAARGGLVDEEALISALREKRIAGAGLDVFVEEPVPYDHPLLSLDNVILTPHIGGSTAEAQDRIGVEVARKLVAYSDVGATLGAVNFPEVQLPARPRGTRFMHVHHNVPGILGKINDIFSSAGINIAAQYLETDPEIGYVVVEADTHRDDANQLLEALKALDGTIRARLLYQRR